MKDFKELYRIMDTLSDYQLMAYWFDIYSGKIIFENIHTGKVKEEYNIEMLDYMTIELGYRGIL